jgi:hypothetical protein
MRARVHVFCGVVALGLLTVSSARAQYPVTPPPTGRAMYIHLVGLGGTGPPRLESTAFHLYNEGFNARVRTMDNGWIDNQLVILDFGIPKQDRDHRGRLVHGWWSRGGRAAVFLDPYTVQNLALAYAYGYLDAMAACPDQQQFDPDFFDNIILGIGVANYDSNGNGFLVADNGWMLGQTVHELNLRLAAAGCRAWVDAALAVDVEGCYGSPARTLDWLGGYAPWGIIGEGVPLIYYGDACGCPTSGQGTASRTCACDCSGSSQQWQRNLPDWTQEELWQAADNYAAVPFPLPQVYTTTGNMARQWQQISLWSYLNHWGRMHFAGPLSQSDACQQRGGCRGIDNTAPQAWDQLRTQLQSNANTSQELGYSTDIYHSERWVWSMVCP